MQTSVNTKGSLPGLHQAPSSATDTAAAGRDFGLLAGVLAAGQLILAIVIAWLMVFGLALGQALVHFTDAVLGGGLAAGWSAGDCLLLGVAGATPLVALTWSWLRSSVDPDAAGPLSVLGVALRPGPVAIATATLWGVVMLVVAAAWPAADEVPWRGAVTLSAAVNSVALVWRSGATVAAGGWRSVALWALAALLTALCVGAPVHLW